MSGIDSRLTTYGDPGFSRYLRRAFLASAGYDAEDLGRPIVGIVDTSSDYTTCHRYMPEMVTAVKRGILEAGGLPFSFPTISLGEILLSPTSMLFRNLAAMDTEEMIRAQPMDSVVLLGGCDKTVPAQLMAAASANVPALLLVAGPMRTSAWNGERIGACTDCRRFWADHRGGVLDAEEIEEVQDSLCPTGGTCMVMGTASTMACLTEALGMMMPGGATAPSGSGERLRIAVATGRQAVNLAKSPLATSAVLTRAAFHNAVAVLGAIGGSTNAVLHLIATARRAGVELTLDDIDSIAREVPLLVDCKPSGANYMEDFHRAGGMPRLLEVLSPKLDRSVQTATGRPLVREKTRPPADAGHVVRTLEDPLGPAEALACLKGTLAPMGAVIKASAASSALLRHRGPAIVFNSPQEAAVRLEDADLNVTEQHVLVLRNAGPVGAGMPEAGSLPIPRSLVRKGIRDMVRVSDARMSGTAYGTVVLHCSPEAAVGGPLALVEDGDLIELDVPARRLDLLVSPSQLKSRVAHPPERATRGWLKLYQEHVLPAHLGADMDFLTAPVPSSQVR
jgi:dihydroxy-acid dehydratase